MATELFFQNPVFSKFILPFLLIFFIVYALLQKTKVFGDDVAQVNALIAFVIGLVFVGVAYPKEVVENLILFMTVAIVVVFVLLIIMGFATGHDLKIESTGLRWFVGIIVVVVVLVATLWATGIEGGVFDFLFRQSWSSEFWTNVLFVVLVGIALAVIIRSSK